ncbi:putative nucleotide-sugar transporter [Talaromyces proteolyticus]|uniref:Nucleotide-sugar transporter n=1 Tax=Talaromyces proteolyticus TaxID=1131652 RepID=A0AAD4PZR8_9EURO|nr:putative nucleotide-sugar transporter [Talaromyces proteolyticus]KAH8696261.1 putative nucleotide-sugar transporter [Talaromyces proteolyticus]
MAVGASRNITGHHRRRSSVLTAAGPSQLHAVPTENYVEREGRLSPREDGPKGDDQRSLTQEDTDSSDLSSIAESNEADSDDGINDDEETGLTAKQRNERRLRRKKQRRKLDARIAGVKGKTTNVTADKSVAMKLMKNVALIGLWYFFSLSISIYNKWMFSEDDVVFPFPVFTTSLHMLVQFTLAALILYFIPSLRPKRPHSASDEPEPIMSKMFYLTRLVPCGTATSLDIGLGNMSLKYISLTFLTMCKSSALAFVLLFAFVFRLESPSVKLIVVIATMTVGVIMMVAGETAFDVRGFALVIASAFFSGFRWGLTQILLLRNPATSNPFSTMFFLTPVMFISLLAIAIGIEGPNDVAEGLKTLSATHGPLRASLLLIFPGALAFCMIASEFALLKRSSVVTLSICGIFKEVVTISAAGVVFHDKLTVINVSGLVVTIASIAAYNYMKISKMRADALMELEEPEVEEYSISPVPEFSNRQNRAPNYGLGLGFGTGDGETRGAYHSVPEDVPDQYLQSNEEGDENVNITPRNDVRRGRFSFPVHASGTFAAPGGLQEELQQPQLQPPPPQHQQEPASQDGA